MPLTDQFERPLRSLRLSVTDRCNLRCSYCMPEEEYTWLAQDDILSFEEMSELVDAFCDFGVDRVRITGGEPLLRRDLPELVRLIAAKPRVTDLALTTNGVLLARHAESLHEAGLHRVTVSLDTLDADTFALLTRRNDLGRVLEGIAEARRVFGSLKLDTVVMRGVNDREIGRLLDFGRDHDAEVRFIEYMDVGGATQWSMDRVVSRREILELVSRERGAPTALAKLDAAPADQYRLPDGSVFGVISSTTQPFCSTCDRSRITADGHWFTCLYARTGTNLLRPLRAPGGPEAIREIVARTWGTRTDRGAMDRFAMRDRGSSVAADELKANPHLEMHTRGG